MPQKDITIKIESSNPIDQNNQATSLQAIANLNKEDMQNIFELAKNKKALQGLRENKEFLISMFG